MIGNVYNVYCHCNTLKPNVVNIVNYVIKWNRYFYTQFSVPVHVYRYPI